MKTKQPVCICNHLKGATQTVDCPIHPLPTPSATSKSLEDLVAKYITRETHAGSVNRIRHTLTAAINNYTTQAVIKELEAHISDLSYAVGYTDDQPFLKRQLELCKERLDKLKGGIDE